MGLAKSHNRTELKFLIYRLQASVTRARRPVRGMGELAGKWVCVQSSHDGNEAAGDLLEFVAPADNQACYDIQELDITLTRSRELIDQGSCGLSLPADSHGEAWLHFKSRNRLALSCTLVRFQGLWGRRTEVEAILQSPGPFGEEPPVDNEPELSLIHI
eukprot:TRINITY_DN7800_c0_g2_i6.p1 TRINITY_DN7800_c0_g2~~TRINITY_DN7800_c0_g2_i6.p1  ORF type:complete len:159 (+),score=29.66 TRINITY_DN7800_c0_g2_i6:219-695(+)